MKWFAPILLLVILLAVVSLFNKPVPKAEIVLANSAAIESFNPQKVSWSDDIRIAYALYEGLCSVDPHTMKAIPGVAKSWTMSEDGKSYIFHLRSDAKWSNGDPVTAYDFAEAFWYVMLSPDVKCYYINFPEFLRGAKAFIKAMQTSHEELLAEKEKLGVDANGEQMLDAARNRIEKSRALFKETVGVEVIDDYTLRLEVELPTPYFLDIVAFPTLMPLHRKSLMASLKIQEEGKSLWRIDPASLLLTPEKKTQAWRDMVVNGPYVLSDWEYKSFLFLEENPHYWREGFPKSKTFRIDYVEDKNLQYINYKTRAIDILLSMDGLKYEPDIIAEAKAGLRDDLHTVSRFGTYYLALNCKPTVDGEKNPLADPRVRKALALAVNKKEIVEDITKMNQPVASTFTPPNSIPDYETPMGLGFDPEAAKKLLAEAGYPDGQGMPTLQLFYNTGGKHSDNMLAVAGYWKKYLNINVKTDPVDKRIYSSHLKKGTFHVARLGWLGDYGDPTTFLDLFLPDNGNNRMGYDDPAFTALMLEAANTKDPKTRLQILAKAEKIVMEETLPMIPIYHYTNTYLFPTQVEGVSLHPRGLQLYSLMEKKP